MTLGDRIKKARRSLELTQQKFAEQIGTTQNNIASYEIGRREPSASAINNICKTFNINEHWLRTGEGDMFVKQSNEDELSSIVERLLAGETSEFKKRLVRVLAGLDEKHWVLLEEKLKEIVGGQQIPSVSSEPDIYTEADAVAATTRKQFIMEKKAEDTSSASLSDTGNNAGKMA